jgi:hypothetical protein
MLRARRGVRSWGVRSLAAVCALSARRAHIHMHQTYTLECKFCYTQSYTAVAPTIGGTMGGAACK